MSYSIDVPSQRSRPAPSVGTSADAQRRFVIIGERYDVARIIEHPAVSCGDSVPIAGAVTVDVDHRTLNDTAIREIVQKHGGNVLLLVSVIPRSMLMVLGEMAVMLGCRLVTVPPDMRETGLEPILWRDGGHTLIEVAVAPARHAFDRGKRAVDMIAGGVALLFALPIIALAAVAIFFESPGNPLFGHVRVGRSGERFRCWKLRTMHTDAEQRLQEDPALFEQYRCNDFKLPEDADPRVTRIGRWLRKSSLDELPQLWNVVTGTMSLVGPRPIVADELEHYQGQVLTLLSVRPGITGAWAVSGRHHLAYPERASVELAYVRNRSALADLRILVRTVGAIFDPGFGIAKRANPVSNHPEKGRTE